ncbi:MAG: hypothetical protein QOK37_4206 [Thermoanaerobaculia bacterium]|nr:hypothetical protein [Thermoanaerobaculia bacterium]
MIARAVGVAILVACMSDLVLALSRDRTIAQFHHTAWTAKDGAPSQITALAQTTDGFLWIGTARGLFRFDGVQFERYTPPAGVTLPSENIYTIAATPDGGLWISFRSRGLGFLKSGRLTVFTRPEEIPQSWVYFFASDHDSRLWAGTYEGLALRQGMRWLEIGPEWNLERGRVWSMIADREGTLWVGIGTRLRFLRRGSTRFEDAERLKAEFPRITLPVMILHGTTDKATRPSGSQFFYDTAGSSDKTLKLYDGGFHDLLNDTDRQAVMADVRQWIAARLPAS